MICYYKMKKRLGHLIAGNFYIYILYSFIDAKGKIFYIAEPRGEIGATRGADTVEELQQILDNDVQMLNYIARENQRRVR